jgi:hypothetical protein
VAAGARRISRFRRWIRIVLGRRPRRAWFVSPEEFPRSDLMSGRTELLLGARTWRWWKATKTIR